MWRERGKLPNSRRASFPLSRLRLRPALPESCHPLRGRVSLAQTQAPSGHAPRTPETIQRAASCLAPGPGTPRRHRCPRALRSLPYCCRFGLIFLSSYLLCLLLSFGLRSKPPAGDQASASFFPHRCALFPLRGHGRDRGVAKDRLSLALVARPSLAASARTCQSSPPSPAASGGAQVPGAEPEARRARSLEPTPRLPCPPPPIQTLASGKASVFSVVLPLAALTSLGV